MTESIETREPQRAPAPSTRQPLTRERILQAGLRLIDQQGLEAFTMRKLAQELGVDPMSIYRHVENKDALLDGVAEVLWGEVELPGSETGWEALLRSMATSLRARQTAEVLARTLPVGAIEQDCDLCELHPGGADGLSWEAYRATYGAFDLLTSPTHPFAPGAESWLEFVERVRATLERLARRFAGQTVVAVTHAGFIVASVLVLFDIPRPGTSARLDPGYTSLTEWRVAQARWQLVRFNDTSHLTDGDAYDE